MSFQKLSIQRFPWMYTTAIWYKYIFYNIDHPPNNKRSRFSIYIYCNKMLPVSHLSTSDLHKYIKYLSITKYATPFKYTIYAT